MTDPLFDPMLWTLTLFGGCGRCVLQFITWDFLSAMFLDSYTPSPVTIYLPFYA